MSNNRYFLGSVFNSVVLELIESSVSNICKFRINEKSDKIILNELTKYVIQFIYHNGNIHITVSFSLFFYIKLL